MNPLATPERTPRLREPRRGPGLGCLAAALFFVGATHLHAAHWRPTERLLHAVRYVESSHGLFTWGDNGQSLGDYQMCEAAWTDVNTWRKAQGLPVFDYSTYVWNRKISRAYAADYLAILHQRLKQRINRSPTAAEVYAAYNMGLTSFARCQYQLAKVNPTTARKCRIILALMAGP